MAEGQHAARLTALADGAAPPRVEPACPASPSLPPSSANACAPWESTPCPAAVPRSPTSPPTCPQPYSQTSCTSPQEPRSEGRTTPEATGPHTPPPSPANTFTRPDQCLARPAPG